MQKNLFLNFNSTYIKLFSIWSGKYTKIYKKLGTIFCLPRLCFYRGTIFTLSLPDNHVQSVKAIWHYFWFLGHRVVFWQKTLFTLTSFLALDACGLHFHTRPKIKFKKNQKNLKKHKKQSLKKQDEKAFLSIIYC